MLGSGSAEFLFVNQVGLLYFCTIGIKVPNLLFQVKVSR